VDYDLERLMWVWRATVEQDWKLGEINQAGVNSRKYQPGPYAKPEHYTERFVQWYLNQMTGGRCHS
jgi:glycine betaine monooxygenase A